MFKWKALAGIVILFATLPAGAFSAAIAAQTSRSAQQAATLSHKVILPETSIDGPAFASASGSSNGQETGISVIAWTGTDPFHHLNLMTSVTQFPNPPVQFSNKLTLHETSPFRPSLVMGGASSGTKIGVVIAWTGTDPNHSLNVLVNPYGVAGTPEKKLTLKNESSVSSPALTLGVGPTGTSQLFLYWTGADPNHSLNVLPLSFPSLAPGAKTILSQFSSTAGPNLTQIHLTNSHVPLVLNWTTPTHHLNFADSNDGVHFTSALGAGGLPQLSAAAPDTVAAQVGGRNAVWMAWTGTDPAHFLNLEWTTSYPQWPDPAATKTVLSETALGGPQIAASVGLLIAWTGTDPIHHLNVAEWSGS